MKSQSLAGAPPRFSRVTVVASGRRVDLSVPADAPLVEVLPELVRLTGERAADEEGTPLGWALFRLNGVALDSERSLAEAGVRDGELLYLRGLDEAVAPPVVEDFVEAVAAVVDAMGGRWRPIHGQRLLIGLSAAAWAAGALALLPVSGSQTAERAAVGLTAAAALLVVAALLARTFRQPAVGAAAAAAAWPWWALGAAQLSVWLAAAGGLSVVAAAVAGVAVGAVAAGLAVRMLREPAAAVALTGTMLAAAAAAVDAVGITPAQSAAGLVLLTLVVAAFLPGIAARAGGLLRAGDGDAASTAVLADQVGRGRRLLGWLLAGTAVTGATGMAVLAVGNPAAQWLCAAAILAFALRARHHSFLSEVLPWLVAASVGAAALVAELARASGATAEVGASLATGAVLTVAALLAGGRRLSPQARQWLNRAELTANIALVPLALWVVGAFGALGGAARGA
jgi:ESX secretion system protein EccD